MSSLSKHFCLTILLVGVAGCNDRTPEQSNVVDVTATGLKFEAPSEIPSGWSTFRLDNLSQKVHFGLLWRMPEGMGIAGHQAELAPVFQRGMDLLNEGEADAALEEFGKAPAWFGEMEYMGGPGLVSSGNVAETTLYLDPGTYVMECYVKTDGIFHSYSPNNSLYAMVHEFTVTSDSSTAAEPEPTLHVAISSEGGIEIAEEPTAGEQIVAVQFEDQIAHENFAGNDVHLVRLDDDTDMDELTTWLDWREPTGLETPAPAEFSIGE